MKILASDYDGTLKQKPTLDHEDISAIKKWRDLGNLFGIISGRSMDTIISEVRENAIEVDFLIGNNGGIIYNMDHQLINEKYISGHIARLIMRYICEQDVITAFHTNDGYYRQHYTSPYTQEDLKQIEQSCLNNKVAQIVVHLDDEEAQRLISTYLNENYHNEVEAFMNIKCIDIVPFGVNKGYGMKKIIEHYRWDEKQVYTIGDSYNDLSMLERYHGCAINSGKHEVLEAIKVHADQVKDYIDLIV